MHNALPGIATRANWSFAWVLVIGLCLASVVGCQDDTPPERQVAEFFGADGRTNSNQMTNREIYKRYPKIYNPDSVR